MAPPRESALLTQEAAVPDDLSLPDGGARQDEGAPIASSDPYAMFRDELLAEGLLLATGHEGLFLRSEGFERIVRGIDAIVTRAGADLEARAYHFPLVMAGHLLEQTDYVRSFPDLLGTVNSFMGDERGHARLLDTVESGEDWSPMLGPTGLALCSAACHPLYPTQAGALPEGGRVVEVFGQCFRHEPSVDPARMQVFRQHEFVQLGDESMARAHRDRWVERGLALHAQLGLEVEAVVANDPFFGRTGNLLAANQREQALKIEIVTAICSAERPTAITSANCHLDHFGHAFGITTVTGDTAHTACVGFGVERITLALLRSHGLHSDQWPDSVRKALGL
jgi:seryl-tRNA synthetase